jgi:hypothetical protein
MSMDDVAHTSPEFVVTPLTVYSRTLLQGVGALMPHIHPGHPGTLSEADELNFRYILGHPESYGQLVAQPRIAGEAGLQVVGALTLSIIRGAAQPQYARIEDFVIDPGVQLESLEGDIPAQKRVIGRRLLDAADVWCEERNAAYVTVRRGPQGNSMLFQGWASQITSARRIDDMVFRKDYRRS